MKVGDGESEGWVSLLLVGEDLQRQPDLGHGLGARGYRVRVIVDADAAASQAVLAPPDLIVLALDPAGRSGLDDFERLRGVPELAGIPIMVAGANLDPMVSVRAFAMGAVDVVSPPFGLDELAARIDAHLRVHRGLQRLADRFTELRERERLRDRLVHMVVHDMRTPLTMVLCNLDIALTQSLPEDARASVEEALAGANALMTMMASMLDLSRLEAGEMPVRSRRCDLAHLVGEAVRLVKSPSCPQPVTVVAPPVPVMVDCDADLIRRVLCNLAGNAVRIAPGSKPVTIHILPLPDRTRVEVSDLGPRIPEAFHGRLFDRYGQVECREHGAVHSTGPGLPFCRLALAAHRGTVGVQANPEGGNTFWFELPARPVP